MEKKAQKKWIAKFLVLVMVVSCFTSYSVNSNTAKAGDYTKGGCVRWLKARVQEKVGITLPPTGYNKHGVAGANNYWYTLNYSKGSEPRENSIAVWDYSTNEEYKNYGHVAFVESVNGNNVTLSEGGYEWKDKYGGYHTDYYLGNKGVRCYTTTKENLRNSRNSFLGYIYLSGTPVIQKPANPSGVTLNQSDFGIGDVVTVNWNAVSGATGYHVVLYSSSGIHGQSINVGGTSASFQLNYAETYRVDVAAYNSAGSSGYMNSVNFNVHNNVNVNYVDWENKLITSQNVKWGGNASAPVPPSREGYTFQQWSSDGKNVKSDTTITAVYKINTYSVSFVDYKGEVIDRVQKVEYNSSAVEPENVPCKNGYVFVGWDTDQYKSVNKNLTVKATYVWENSDLPIITEITSAKRNEAGTSYVVDVDLCNFPDDFTKGKIVVGLITKSGKMVASETRTISIPEEGETTERITVLYSGVASTVQVSMIGVIDDETTGTPKSKMVTSVIDLDNEWSNWSTTVPEGEDIIKEERTEYRYKDSKIIKSVGTPTAPNGYSLTNVSNSGTYTDWGPWSGWSGNAVGSNALTEVQSQNGYRVYAFVCDSCGRRDPYGGGCSRCGAGLRWDQMTDTMTGYARGYLSTDEAGYNMSAKGRVIINNVSWYFELNGKSNGEPQSNSVSGNGYGQVIYPIYRYRTRQEYKNYTYWQNEYSSWQPEEVSSSSTRKVDTRTVYRFKSNSTEIPCYNYKRYKYTNINSGKVVYSYSSKYADSMDYPGEWEYSSTFTEYNKISTVEENIDLYNGVGEESWYRADINDESSSTIYETKDTLEDKKGIVRNIEGDLPNASGKVATLLVYKGQNDDPIASQIEYISQTVIDDEGHYKFDYITKEEPSVKTGDFVVTLGIEGSTNYQVIDRIEAPKQVYSVDFVDDDGNNIGETKKVIDGGTVEAPEAPEKDGYEFIGWDTGLKNIHGNTVITAQYRKKIYTVIFVDWDKTSIETKEYSYGDELSIDSIPTREGKKFDKWVDSDGKEIITVTKNMIVEASYRDAIYSVVFEDWDGNIISEQELSYGETAEIPADLEAPNEIQTFKCWNNCESVYYVTNDIVVTPVAEYKSDSQIPLCTVEGGTYDNAQTVALYSLQGNTEIYYSILSLEEAEECNEWVSKSLFKKYETPIEISESSVLLTYAETKEKNPSEVIRKQYIIGDENIPTAQPTEAATPQPTEIATAQPTKAPTVQPTETATAQPTEAAIAQQTEKPTEAPTAQPTKVPTVQPTETAMAQPTEKPTDEPTTQPTKAPTEKPTEKPVVENRITLNDGTFWDRLLTIITFGEYKYDVSFTVSSSLDNAMIYYYIDKSGDTKGLSIEELENITYWEKYDGEVKLTNAMFVVYAKIVDENDVYYVCTDGLNIIESEHGEIKNSPSPEPASPTPTPAPTDAPSQPTPAPTPIPDQPVVTPPITQVVTPNQPAVNNPQPNQTTSNSSTNVSLNKVKGLSLKGKKGIIKIKWKKSNSKEYEIQIATKKNFKKKKYKSKQNGTSLNLYINKGTYYVRVRACKYTNNNKYVYGAWSSVKKCKVK